jgi:hypothetical protein
MRRNGILAQHGGSWAIPRIGLGVSRDLALDMGVYQRFGDFP